MSHSTASRYSYIDTLRGIAALYVVIGHSLTWYYRNISSDVGLPFEWIKQLTSALAGVFLFFAISGYVIPSSFQRERYEGAKSFVIRRFFRLYPLFWVSLIPGVIHCFRAIQPTYSLETVLYNATMIPGFFGQKFVVGVYWTLAHELLFYLLCLALHLAGWLQQSQKIALVTLGLGVGYWFLRLGEWVGFWGGGGTFFQKTIFISMTIMFWGALWRCFQEKKCTSIWEKIALAFVPLQSVILVCCRPFYSHIAAKANFPISFAVSIALAIAVFILGTTLIKLKHPVLLWCGTVSYSLYLFHMFVVLYVARGFSYFYSGVPSFLIFALLVLCGSCLVSWMGYYFVERPFIAFGKKMTSLPIKVSRNLF